VTATAPAHSFQEIAVDLLRRPELSPGPAALSREQAAARLQQVQRQRARLAAEEAGLVLRLAEPTPDADDPAPGTPGAGTRSWQSDAELPGVSEFFVPELAHVLNCGRMTANHLAVRAWLWRESLPATLAALAAGELDEARGRALADVLAHADPAVARQVEALLLPDAVHLTIGRPRALALALLLERDAAAVDQRRRQAERAADVRAYPAPREGMAAFAAELPAPVSAACWDAVDRYAAMLEADGDPRPIGELRAAVVADLILRPWDDSRPAVTARLQITATLAALAGRSTTAAEVSGLPITAGHLRALLDALGLRAPEGGSLAFGLTDPDGRLRATVDADQLRRLVRRGCPRHPGTGTATDGGCGCPVLDQPPPTGAYSPTAAQRAFVQLRDRTCRTPGCGQQVSWADLDHVVPHGRGGPTACTNLLPVPEPSPAEDLRPRLAVRPGPRRHPARHQPVRGRPHHPATGPAPSRPRPTAGSRRIAGSRGRDLGRTTPGRRPTPVVTAGAARPGAPARHSGEGGGSAPDR